MGLKHFLSFGGLFSKEETTVREAAGKTIDNDEEGWRRLTGDARRDLSSITQTRMQELGVYMWRTNPLANRLIELPVAFLLAEGVTLQVKDEEAQKWLRKFWNDPINNMDIKLPKKVRELALYGEQCYPAFVNEMNGHVRLGYLDPGLIETVVTDPDNIEQPIGVVTKKDRKGIARRYRIIVNGPEDAFQNGHAISVKLSPMAIASISRSTICRTRPVDTPTCCPRSTGWMVTTIHCLANSSAGTFCAHLFGM